MRSNYSGRLVVFCSLTRKLVTPLTPFLKDIRHNGVKWGVDGGAVSPTRHGAHVF